MRFLCLTGMILAMAFIGGVPAAFAANNSKMIKECEANVSGFMNTRDSDNFMVRAMDRKGFCACVIGGAAVKSEEQMAKVQSCLSKNSRVGAIKLCEQEILPKLRAEAKMGMDCACFFDESIARSTAMAQKGLTTVAPEVEAQMNAEILQKCMRP